MVSTSQSFHSLWCPRIQPSTSTSNLVCSPFRFFIVNYSRTLLIILLPLLHLTLPLFVRSETVEGLSSGREVMCGSWRVPPYNIHEPFMTYLLTYLLSSLLLYFRRYHWLLVRLKVCKINKTKLRLHFQFNLTSSFKIHNEVSLCSVIRF